MRNSKREADGERPGSDAGTVPVEQYRQLFTSAGDPILITDLDAGVILDANPRAEEVYGYGREALVGGSVHRLVRSGTRWERIVARVCQEGAVDACEGVHVRADGSTFDVLLSGSLVDHDGRPAMLTVHRDLTAGRQAERVQVVQLHLLELIARGKPLSDILDTLLHYVEAHDPRFRRALLLLSSEPHVVRRIATSLPDSFQQVLGRLPFDLLADGFPLWQREQRVLAMDFESDPQWRDHRHLARAHGLAGCWAVPVLSKEKQVLGMMTVYLQQAGRPAGQDLRILEMFAHMASIAIERDHSEAALRESEERFRSLVQHSTDILAVLESDGAVRYVSPSVARVLGFEPDEFTLDTFYDILHPDDIAGTRDRIRRLHLGPESIVSFEHRVRVQDGRWVYLESTISNQLANPAIRGLVLNARDVTERRLAEEALQRANNELEQRVRDRTAELVEANEQLQVEIQERREVEQALRRNEALLVEAERIAQFGSWNLDLTKGELQLSQEGYRILGLRRDRTIRPSTAYRHIHARDRALVRRQLDAAKERGSAVLEYHIVRPDGEERVVQTHAEVVRDASGAAVRMFGTVLDVTEQRMLEQALVRASETERRSVGRDLHDGLGQLLSGIAYLSQTLTTALTREGIAFAEDSAEITRLVEEAIGQTRSLSKLLLPVELEENGLEAALHRHVEHVRVVYGISCIFQRDEFTTTVDKEPALHLYRIAQEAVHNAVRHGKAKHITIRFHSDVEELRLSVIDDGVGLCADAPATGEGLGLRTMRHRAQIIGAVLEIRSGAEGGTEVCCRLPLVEAA